MPRANNVFKPPLVNSQLCQSTVDPTLSTGRIRENRAKTLRRENCGNVQMCNCQKEYKFRMLFLNNIIIQKVS